MSSTTPTSLKSDLSLLQETNKKTISSLQSNFCLCNTSWSSCAWGSGFYPTHINDDWT